MRDMGIKELRGAPVVAGIAETLKPRIAALAAQNSIPCLGVLRFGQREEDIAYEKGLTKRFNAAGACVKVKALPEDADGLAAQAALTELNDDKSVHGILVLRPLPAWIDEDKLMRLIPAEKDVDGMGMLNAGLLLMGKSCFAPCTAQAVMELISYYGIELNGKAVCIIGRSNVAGKPLAMLLLKENATPTICHTKTADIKKACLDADIIIASAGSAGMLKTDMVNEASVLIDVGINLVGGRLTGDVSREACERAAMYTPVPGGIGAVTTAVLLMHTVEAAEKAQV